jgi:hypothetical protein
MTDTTASIRVLFCFGVLEPFYDLDDAGRKQVFDKLVEAYGDLEGRFGVKVLGTIDDDKFVVGPTLGWPWTCYILADAPSYGAVADVCNILRQFRVGEQLIWRFLKVEARTGRELFFGKA